MAYTKEQKQTFYVKSCKAKKKGDIIAASLYKAMHRESVMNEGWLRIDIKGWI